MFKLGSSVFSAATRTGLLIACLPFPSGLPAVRLLAQEAPPQTEEQRLAREALNKGVQDLSNGQYDSAIAAFQRAKDLDPRLINARLYLATVYAEQYIPGAPSEQNRNLSQHAIDEFKDVLALDPQNISAIDGLGALVFQMAGTPYDAEKFQESKSYHQKHTGLRPNDPEPYYWVGVIDWTLSFRANNELRARYNQEHMAHQIMETEPLPDDAREEYIREYGTVIDEGIDSLKRAIELKPDYDDAMLYLNLMYRRKADTVTYENEREDLLKVADDLINKVKEIKQQRIEPRPQ
jgi:tetratricopeptide (TPR) repeat protein